MIGSVRFGRGATVWFNCVVRGDTDWIIIGEGSNVQDGTVMHTDAGVPLAVGSRVSIGHRALLHGCTVGDDTLIANGAMILDGATIGSRCLIAAGALVPPRRTIPDGSVVMGMPGAIVRQTNESDLQLFKLTAEHYTARGRLYRRDLKVDPRWDMGASS